MAPLKTGLNLTSPKEEMIISLSSLNLKNKILLVTVKNEEDYDDAVGMVAEAYDSLIEAGCIFSLVLTPDMSIETLDEQQMNVHGWFRKDN